MNRRPMTKARRDRIALNHFIRIYGALSCALCSQPLDLSGPWIAEHMTPFALGGADDDGEDNVRPACKACADRKTHGTAATGHRGDTSAIAKAKRLAKGGKTRGPGPKSRPTQWPKGRKMQSRPFPKTHRPMRAKEGV